MAKVQFNCRLEEAVRDRIVELATGRSQAEVVAAGIAALDMQGAQGRVEAEAPTLDPATVQGVSRGMPPRPETSRERVAREKAERDAGARARTSIGDDPSLCVDPEFVQD